MTALLIVLFVIGGPALCFGAVWALRRGSGPSGRRDLPWMIDAFFADEPDPGAQAISDAFEASLHDLTKPLKPFADGDPRLAARRPERTVTCHGCRGAKTQACASVGCGPSCDRCMGFGRVACGVCAGLGHVPTLASADPRQLGR